MGPEGVRCLQAVHGVGGAEFAGLDAERKQPRDQGEQEYGTLESAPRKGWHLRSMLKQGLAVRHSSRRGNSAIQFQAAPATTGVLLSRGRGWSRDSRLSAVAALRPIAR